MARLFRFTAQVLDLIVSLPPSRQVFVLALLLGAIALVALLR